MAGANILQADAAKSDDCVDFLIITALEDERNAVLFQLPNNKKIQDNGFPTYYRATLKTDTGINQENRRVAVTALAAMGNISAAVRTTRCIQALKPHYVLIVGIAGGVEGEVNLGDVVVSNQVIYYEHAKETPSGSEPRVREGTVDPLLLDRASNYDTEWRNLIRAERPTEVKSAETPEVHFGLIASGEKVIADSDRTNALRRLYPKLCAIEMESYGAAAAAAESDFRPRFIAIQGISDYADAQKNDVWREYAADSAAAFTVWLMNSGGISFPDDSQPRTRKTLIAIRHQSLDPLPTRLTENTLPEVLMPANLVHVELDQTDLYGNGRLKDPVEAVRRQSDIVHSLSEVRSSYPDAEIAYYGIAHIPLLFHIGYQVLSRTPAHFFEHNRTTHRWDYLDRSEDYPQIRIAGFPDFVSLERGDVIVRTSISYLVTSKAIEGIVTNPIASLHLSIDEPKRDSATSMDQIEQYSVVFRDVLDEIHKLLPNTERVHVFYAGPVALAVNLGRQISNTIHPRIIVYNHSSADNPPGYAWGLEVTADVNSPEFMTKIRR